MHLTQSGSGSLVLHLGGEGIGTARNVLRMLRCPSALMAGLILAPIVFSLLITVSGAYAPATPFYRPPLEAQRQLKQEGAQRTYWELVSHLFPLELRYYLFFGFASCLVAAAIGASLCTRLHRLWFALVSVPVLLVLPNQRLHVLITWAIFWAAGGLLGALIVAQIAKSRGQLSQQEP